jgi:hypothetical protein
LDDDEDQSGFINLDLVVSVLFARSWLECIEIGGFVFVLLCLFVALDLFLWPQLKSIPFTTTASKQKKKRLVKSTESGGGVKSAGSIDAFFLSQLLSQ